MKNIEVKGAKQHNLKNIDVIIPREINLPSLQDFLDQESLL